MNMEWQISLVIIANLQQKTKPRSTTIVQNIVGGGNRNVQMKINRKYANRYLFQM